MKDTLFNRIYSYRESENKNSKENYLTEIFAYTLENDESFFMSFLNLLQIKTSIEKIIRREIKTQVSYINYSRRPDIEIKFDDTVIIIENKIDSEEGNDQLADYIEILKSKNESNKFLLYLTKYYDYKEIDETNFKFYPLRWYQINELITAHSKNEITKEFKQYLKIEGMEKIKNFDVYDLSAIMTISSTVSKMDELLNQVRPYFQKKIGSTVRRSLTLKNDGYYDYVGFVTEKSEFFIETGFYWVDDLVSISVLIDSYNDSFKNTKLAKILSKELISSKNNKWEINIEKDFYCLYSDKELTDYFKHKDEHIPLIKKEIEKRIDELSVIVKKNPTLFKKSSKVKS